MEQHPYLSPEWLATVRELRAGYRETHGAEDPLLVNYTMTGVPFANDGRADFHLDVRSPLFYEPGHVANPDLWVVTDYETARGIYRDSSWNLERLRSAYASGLLQVEGDLDAIPGWWIDVVQDADHIALWDQIMLITA
ncbi:MAG: hypothetical protein ACR2PK_13935 [Acidimicrobiales bacterium]